MVFADLEPRTGRLHGLALRPKRLQRLQLVDADAEDADWLATRLDRECRKLGTGIDRHDDEMFRLRWVQT